jgi:hypothetical protein
LKDVLGDNEMHCSERRYVVRKGYYCGAFDMNSKALNDEKIYLTVIII